MIGKHFWIVASLCAATAFGQEAATVNRARVNIRGGPNLASEVVGQLQKGDKVTVIGQIFSKATATNKPPGEPDSWVEIKLPPSTPVWVFTPFLENNTVRVNRLNLRGGPGENFSVVGRLEKGAAVKELRRVEDWMEIEAADAARGYVDATYLERTNAPVAQAQAEVKLYEPPSKPAATTTPESKPEPVAIIAEAPKGEKKPEPTKPAVKSDPEPAPVEKTADKNETAPPVAAKPEENAAKPAEAPKVVETPPIQPAPAQEPRVLPSVAPPIAGDAGVVVTKRIVRREGQVRTTKFNIQAPTYFELIGERNKTLNYLSAEKSGFKLKDYKGLRVVVTGEEWIDPRYPERPLLEIETIEVAP